MGYLHVLLGSSSVAVRTILFFNVSVYSCVLHILHVLYIVLEHFDVLGWLTNFHERSDED